MITTEKILDKMNNKVDAFICNNSGLARGVISVLKAKGLDNAKKIFVAGSDADLANIRFIAQDKQTIDIWKKIKPLAEKAAEIAVIMAKNPLKKPEELFKINKYIDNGYIAKLPVIVTPIELINKNNIETLISSGVFSKEQIYSSNSIKTRKKRTLP